MFLIPQTVWHCSKRRVGRAKAQRSNYAKRRSTHHSHSTTVARIIQCGIIGIRVKLIGSSFILLRLFQIQQKALTKQSDVNHPLISTAKNPVLQKGQITF